MKNKYIQSLLHEVQQLESKVAALKDNKTVSFSFFKEAFKQTQEIMRLLHTLEFVQIEDMKSQMEKLVQFLSEASEQTESSDKEHEENNGQTNIQKVEAESNQTEQEETPLSEFPSSSKGVSDLKIEEDYSQFNTRENKLDDSTKKHKVQGSVSDEQKKVSVNESLTDDSQINPLHVSSKSLNDMQATSHTISDTKRSISLNDRFLFQRELFDNDRHAMNNMMIKMQSFTTFEDCKSYLKNNTDWDFKDETVGKFLDLLKEDF